MLKQPPPSFASETQDTGISMWQLITMQKKEEKGREMLRCSPHEPLPTSYFFGDMERKEKAAKQITQAITFPNNQGDTIQP